MNVVYTWVDGEAVTFPEQSGETMPTAEELELYVDDDPTSGFDSVFASNASSSREAVRSRR